MNELSSDFHPTDYCLILAALLHKSLVWGQNLSSPLTPPFTPLSNRTQSQNATLAYEFDILINANELLKH